MARSLLFVLGNVAQFGRARRSSQMRQAEILLCAALLAAVGIGCGSEERVVRRTTTIQEPIPTPAQRTTIHRSVEERVIE
jgi:hypothetical protein